MLARFGITAVYSIVTLHTAELFPTNLRSSALGTSSTIVSCKEMQQNVLPKFIWFCFAGTCRINSCPFRCRLFGNIFTR